MKLSHLLTGLFALLLPAASFADDWPTYLHDVSRVGATDETLKTPLFPRWIHRSPVAPKRAWEGPREAPIEGQVMQHRVAFDDSHLVAISDGRVYFGSIVDHQMYCVDANTGKTIWTHFTEGPIRLAPTVWQGNVYFGSDDGQVYCLNGKSGELVWKLRIGPKDERLLARGAMISRWPVRTGVLIDDGVAFFGAGIFPHETVFLAAADARTGKVLWKNDSISQRDAGRDDTSPQGYLLANEQFLFVPSGRTLPAAFDRKTGKYEFKRTYSWRTSGGGVVGGTKALLADGQLYSFGAHHMLALDQASGKAGKAYIGGQQMTLRGDLSFISDGTQVFAVDREKHAAASIKKQALFVKRRSLRGNREELAKLDKQMAELAKVGVLWRQPFDGDAALIRTGNLVVAGGEGKVAAFDIETGAPKWDAKVEGEARGLAVSDGRLLVSTTSGNIYGFGPEETGAIAEFPTAYEKSPYPRDDLSERYATAATQILDTTGVSRGYCLVLGAERGRLAYELAKRSELKVYCVEADAKKVAEARKTLNRAGFYGSRVTFVESGAAETPLSNYFADLVVSDHHLLTGKLPASTAELGRYVKPCGGQVCLGQPGSRDFPALAKALRETYLRDDAKIEAKGDWAVLTRGKLPGAGDWSHQYANVANTSMSSDYRVKGSLGVLWYGDPGPSQMINRHEAAAAPLSTNGRFFVQGLENIRGYDSYNGTYLWEYKNPGAIRTGVFNNQETNNLAASDDALFVAVDEKCTQLNAATGKVEHIYKAPQSDDDVARSWGYVAHHQGMLFGTSTIRTELAAALRRRGRKIGASTDAIFAYDVKSHEKVWSYPGKNIMHVTIAIGGDRMYFVESSITNEEREELLRQDKTELKKLKGEAAKKKEAELKRFDVRKVVCLDIKTGEKVWAKSVDVTNVSGVSAGGGNICVMYHDGHVVIGGANANGHYWRQFLSGEFKKRRLVVLDANDGEKLWSRDANHMNRPVIVGEYVIAEPWSFQLHTGEERKRVHPLTGEETKWQFSRPGHHCGIITATPNMMLFRSGFIGYYDLYADSGTRHFAGQRLGCWVNAIPGNGLVMIPEASAGCVCLFSITSTVVLEPREDRDPAWGIYSASGPATPVKRLAMNLGAPGDRRDQFGTLWLSYPRPKSVGRMEYVFDIKPTLASGGGYITRNDKSLSIEGADTPWVMTSAAEGLTSFALPLLAKKDEPARYNVRLHFAELEELKAGDRVFDIKLQGAAVAEGVDVVKEAGGVKTALVREFKGVNVSGSLQVDLVRREGKTPILSAIEVEIAE